MLLHFLLICTLLLLFVYNCKRWRLIVMGAKVPGPLSFPFLGHVQIFLGKPENVFRKITNLRKEYKRLVALWLGPELVVNIFQAKDAEVVFKDKTTVKADLYKFLRPWLGESILISEGAKFRKNKKMLTPAFHSWNLKQYMNVFSQHARGMVEEMTEKVNGPEFDVHSYLKMSTMYSLLETSMGVKKETLGERTKDYIDAVEHLGRFAQIRVNKIWLHPDFIFKFSELKRQQDKYLEVVRTLTNQVIKKRREEYALVKLNGNEDSKNWPIFLDKFFDARNEEDGSKFTDDEIRDEVMTMLFAGHDTTSVSLGFCLCLLGLHKDVQNRLYKEIHTHCPENVPVSYEICKDMTYMDQVIQETWRLFPPIPVIGKMATNDILLENYTIPKSSTVVLTIMAIHRDPDQYPHPDNFDPENFHPDRIKERNPCSFIPFSAGQRMCIGQRYSHLLIKVTLANILKRFEISSTTPMHKYKLAGHTSLKRKGGFMISIRLREQEHLKRNFRR